MKIIVLGNSGFIGKNIGEIKGGHMVLPFSRSEDKECNLFDLERTTYIFQTFQPDIIINLASHGGSLHYVSEFAADVLSDNTQMYLNLYKAVNSTTTRQNKKPKIINAISNCSYPGSSLVQIEQEWEAGPPHESVKPFANSKRMLFHLAKCYEKQYGLPSINLVFPNAFGPKDHLDPNKTHALDGMIIRMLKAKKEKQSTFEIWGSGTPIREWIFVKDFINILIKAFDIENSEVINVGQNKGYSIKETAAAIKEVMGYEGDLVFNTNYTDGDPVKILDNTRFKSIFGDYQFVDHLEGIKKTVEYYKLKL